MKDQKLQFDTVVIGGGIAGLCTAYSLLEAGKKVLLVERDYVGQAASWAGGGILSPLKPWTYSKWHNKLSVFSQQCFRKLKAQLESVDLHFEENKTGMVYLDDPVDDQLTTWLKGHSEEAHLLQGDELKTFLNKHTTTRSWINASSAVWMPNISNIRNPRFLQALKQYLQMQPGFCLLEKTEARIIYVDPAVECQSQSLIGVEFRKGPMNKRFIRAHEVIATAGAWSSHLLGDVGIPEVKPIRGQILLYQNKNIHLPYIVMKGSLYLIPRQDGLILAGSTLEDVGFNTDVTQEAYQALHDFACEMIPELCGQRPAKQWAGLRPLATHRDSKPLIGPVSTIKGLWVNTAHFRNGIVHAPGAAQLLVDAMYRGGQTELPLPLNAELKSSILQA